MTIRDCSALVLVAIGSVAAISASVVRTELAGESLAGYPFFQVVRSFNPNEPVQVAVDPTRFPQLVGLTCDLWIVEERTEAEWGATPSLVDVRPGGPQALSIGGSTIQDNTFTVASPGELDSDAGPGLGVGYDVVLDCNRDGLLNGADLIDGESDEPGLYAVHDTVQPGPLAVSTATYSGGTFLTQLVHYPTQILSLERIPLIVISHGWTLNYEQYNYIGQHLASYGYIVMSHENDTGAGASQGTLSASTTTLTNTEYLIAHLGTIAGGAFAGHLDSHRIIFIGHSTGGEGVVRAYTRLRTGDFVPQNFTAADVVLVSSMAPVAFHTGAVVTPYDVNYHQFLAAADTDVQNSPTVTYRQPLAIYDRGSGNRQVNYIHGVGHGWFNEPPSPDWAEGPDLIGREATQKVVNGYYLPLVELYAKDNLAAADFFTRPYEDFHPAGIDPNVILANEHRQALSAGSFVIDDFQTASDPAISSSGGAVSFSVSNLSEVLMQDLDGSFDWTGTQPSNGMTRARFAGDDPRCVVFDWHGAASFYELEVIPSQRDFSDDGYLSFRAAQGTRHPETVLLDAPLSFTVTLRDGNGATGSIDFGVVGRLTHPYERTGYGSGVGWANEFSTIRLRLADFTTNGSSLDLSDIVAIRFEFGPGFGSNQGRIGLDDVEIVKSFEPPAFTLAMTRSGNRASMTWPPAVGALYYNVYRGTIPQEGLGSRGSGSSAYDHVCFERADLFGDGARATKDNAPVPVGTGFYYLVSAVRAGGRESLGQASIDLDPVTPGDQLERPNSAPCP